MLLQESLYCDSYMFSSVEKLSIKKQKHVVCNIYKTSDKNITDNAWIEPLRNECENIKIGQSNVYISIEILRRNGLMAITKKYCRKDITRNTFLK